jgi:hypothetical protein
MQGVGLKILGIFGLKMVSVMGWTKRINLKFEKNSQL